VPSISAKNIDASGHACVSVIAVARPSSFSPRTLERDASLEAFTNHGDCLRSTFQYPETCVFLRGNRSQPCDVSYFLDTPFIHHESVQTPFHSIQNARPWMIFLLRELWRTTPEALFPLNLNGIRPATARHDRRQARLPSSRSRAPYSLSVAPRTLAAARYPPATDRHRAGVQRDIERPLVARFQYQTPVDPSMQRSLHVNEDGSLGTIR
jgi:hypothetical protein